MGNCWSAEEQTPNTSNSKNEFLAFTTSRRARVTPLPDEAPIQDAVSARLPIAAAEGSSSVVDLAKDQAFLDAATWTANLDVPVVKCALLTVRDYTLSCCSQQTLSADAALTGAQHAEALWLQDLIQGICCVVQCREACLMQIQSGHSWVMNPTLLLSWIGCSISRVYDNLALHIST